LEDSDQIDHAKRHHSLHNQFIITAHFRCGDESFIHKSEGHHHESGGPCWYDKSDPIHHGLTDYINRLGNTMDMAKCVKNVIYNYTSQQLLSPPDFNQLLRRRKRVLYEHNLSDASKVASKNLPLVIVASDSISAGEQISLESQWNYTFVSHSACHVELDKSDDCFHNTVRLWFLMSLSDIIVTQTNNGLPTSGFSRFAAVYGLMGNSLRNAAACDVIIPRYKMAWEQIGNWFCQ
jgi:hypothetical protein